MNKFIVASNKTWHKTTFDKVTKESDSLWLFISTPEDLAAALLDEKNPSYIFFLHWSWIVPTEIFQQHECVCFHMTDLPYGRGGSPLQNLILSGNTETKITAFQMIDEVDAGPVYAKRSLKLDGRAEDIYLRAGELCWEMINWIIENQPIPIPQQGQPFFYSRRKPEQSLLPKNGTLIDIYNFIRMLDAPTYPLAFIEHGDFRINFSHANFSENSLEASVTIQKRVPR